MSKTPTKIGSQTVMPNKVVKHRRVNRYRPGDKVTVVSEKYITAVVQKVWVRHKQLTYQVKCGDGTVLNKLPESALLPHIKKWQYNLIKWLSKIGLTIVTQH